MVRLAQTLGATRHRFSDSLALNTTELNLGLRAVQTLVLYSLCEHQLGHATRINVFAQGNAFSVSDNGRGHAISRTVEGAPYLDFIYEHLAFPYGRTASPPVQLQGLGMSLLNQLCTTLEVTVRKPTTTLHIRYASGQRVDHVVIEEANPETGNTISGAVRSGPDSDLVDFAALSTWLSAVQRVNPGLNVAFNGNQLSLVAGGA
jgi:DNA gyrase/topoisomerase IV subunit B